MKKLTTLSILLLGVMAVSATLTSCSCEHEWKEATCTAPKTCTLCGETEGKALGHKFEEATCVLPEICSVCEAENGEPLGHTVVVNEAVEPTCSEEGVTEGKYCRVCNEVFVSQKTIDKLEHIEGNWKVAREASLVKTGKEEKECEICGELLDSRSISKKKPKVNSSSFNFTDEELIEWINEETTATISTYDIGLFDSDSGNTSYRIDFDGEKGALLLHHVNDNKNGKIDAIMSYFDVSSYNSTIGLWVGSEIDSNFDTSEAIDREVRGKSYTSAGMTAMSLELDTDFEVHILAPSEYIADIIS